MGGIPPLNNQQSEWILTFCWSNERMCHLQTQCSVNIVWRMWRRKWLGTFIICWATTYRVMEYERFPLRCYWCQESVGAVCRKVEGVGRKGVQRKIVGYRKTRLFSLRGNRRGHSSWTTAAQPKPPSLYICAQIKASCAQCNCPLPQRAGHWHPSPACRNRSRLSEFVALHLHNLSPSL